MKEFYNHLQQLTGKECWGIVTGVGSIITLSFGAKIPRENPIENPNLSEVCRFYDPEYSLMIYAPWRLHNSTSILSASYYDNSKNGPMAKGLDGILKLSVTNIICEPPCHDLTIHFEENVVLTVFAGDIDLDDDTGFYDFFTPSGVFSVVGDSLIEFEKNCV